MAIHKYTGEVLDVGAEAFKMLGREPKDVEIFRPVRGGNIENFDAVEKMLKAFITRVSGNPWRHTRPSGGESRLSRPAHDIHDQACAKPASEYVVLGCRADKPRESAGSAMLWTCSNCFGCSSRPSWPG